MLLAGLALCVVCRLNPGCRGIRRFVAACFLFFLGFAGFPLRTVLDGKLPVLFSNAALLAAAMCLVDAAWAFREFKPWRSIYVVISIVFAVGFGWYLFLHDDYTARVAVASFLMGPLGIAAGVIMAWKVPPQDRLVYRATAAGFILNGLAVFLRGVAAASGATFDLGHPLPVDYLNLVTLNVAALSSAFGVSLATNLRLQRRTELLALYDTLTGLPNRRYFEDRLEMAEQQSAVTGQRIALIYCDLDDFKGINDTLGHEGGDTALRAVADRLRTVAGEGATLARIGGDEFVVLLERSPDRDGVLDLVEQLRSAAEGEVSYGGQTARVQLSCGVAIYPEDVGSVSDLIRLADAGMYVMKQHGRFSAMPSGTSSAPLAAA